MARKRWDELDLMDNELMNIVASDPNVGIPFCKCVLGRGRGYILFSTDVWKFRKYLMKMD